MLESFQYVKKYWRSHILILHVLQEASNILVILILNLIDVQVYIYLWSSSERVLNHIASKIKISTPHQCLAKKIVTLSGRILSLRNLIYAKIFVSTSSWLQWSQFLDYITLLHDLLHRQDLLKKWFERNLKRLIVFLSIFGKDISPGWFYYSNSQCNFEVNLELFGY